MARGRRGPSATAVIVQTGSNDLDNLGDLAMLEVLIERIRERHKDVTFSVFARDTNRIKSLGDDVHQIVVEQKGEWAAARNAYLGLRRLLPATDSVLRRRFPGLYRSLIRSKARSLANAESVADADMLVVSGGGFLNDVFPGQAWPVFERLGAAIDSHVPFALMGQGLGPLRDSALVTAAKSILPKAELIAVREPLYSVQLLVELGVSRDRILVTGDDAVEPAYRARGQTAGSKIGVNLRIAEYAGTKGADTTSIRRTLHAVAAKNSCELVALPVCVADSPDTASDARVIEDLLDLRDVTPIETPMTTASLFERTSLCRMVVTGSYHAAVFALSQGSPAACLFGSEYYEMKFRGLRAQFGEGCELIDMRRAGFDVELEERTQHLLQAGDAFRDSLLSSARSQIEGGRIAYDRLSAILESAT